MVKINSLELEIFLEVAKELSFSRAANNLFITQPTITKWIKHLEVELNLQLFERNSRQVALTPAGEHLYINLRPAYEQLNSCIQNSQKLYSEQKNHLKIGALYGFDFERQLESHINSFEINHSDISIDFNIYDFQEMQISQKSLDIIFSTNFEMDSCSNYYKVRLEPIPLFLAVSKNNPLSTKKEVSLKEIKDETFLIFSTKASPNGIEYIRKEFFQHGISPNLVMIDNIPSQFLKISRDKGIAITNQYAVQGYEDKVNMIKLNDFHLDLYKVLCYLKTSTNPFVQEFIASLPLP